MSIEFKITHFKGVRVGGFVWSQTVVSLIGGPVGWEGNFGSVPRAIEVISWGRKGHPPINVATYGAHNVFYSVAETMSRREAKEHDGYRGMITASLSCRGAAAFVRAVHREIPGVAHRDAVLRAMDWVAGNALAEYQQRQANAAAVDAFLAGLAV